jgi:UDP-2-acetamido-3-amino-2,3-dideoxy-glucuronate N-acetyltransferase
MSSHPKLALIGAGYWGKNLARNFHSLGALHTLCDSNPETLQSYGEEYDAVCRELSFDTVIANPEISSVAIAAPAVYHFNLAKQALEAGKDVYVEKPLCLNPDDAQALIEIADANDRILMVGHLLQYHAYVEKLAEMVHAGELGKLFHITSNRLNLGKIRQEENSLWSFAPHDISVILRLAGVMPTNVICHGDSYLTDGVADTTLTQLEFDGNLRAHVYVSWLNPFKEQKLTVVGSEGMAVFDDTKPWDEKLIVYRDYLTWSEGNRPTVTKGDGEKILVPQSEPLKSECQHFLDCCNTRQTPRTDGHEGLRVLQVLNAAQQSLESKASVNPSHRNDRPESKHRRRNEDLALLAHQRWSLHW